MSLVRLLTSGKSLIGLQDVTSRYRMRSKNLLPRFGSGKNPFSVAPSEPMPAPAPATNQTARYQMTPAEFAAARLKETKRLPMVPRVEAKPSALKPAVLARLSGLVTRWTQRFNPLARWPERKPGLRLARPGSDHTPVQGELSLDKIKVVRNDLSDADLEIVPAKPVVKPKPERSGQAEPAAELAKP